MGKTAGYSATPLAKKPGIKERFLVGLVNAPGKYAALFTEWPRNVNVAKDARQEKDVIHFFTKGAKELFERLPLLKQEIKEAGMIWISWPKKTSRVPTDITEDIIRAVALRNGLVDVKVCAVDEVWSGLKLVIPLKQRKEKQKAIKPSGPDE